MHMCLCLIIRITPVLMQSACNKGHPAPFITYEYVYAFWAQCNSHCSLARFGGPKPFTNKRSCTEFLRCLIIETVRTYVYVCVLKKLCAHRGISGCNGGLWGQSPYAGAIRKQFPKRGATHRKHDSEQAHMFKNPTLQQEEMSSNANGNI